MDIKKSNIHQIDCELSARHSVWLGLYGDPHEDLKDHFTEVCSELFTDRVIPINIQTLSFYSEDYNVSPVLTRDVIALAEQAKFQISGQDQECNIDQLDIFSYKYSHYDKDRGNTLISINLSHSSDDEIVRELKRLLPEIRSALAIDNPNRYNTYEKHDNLFNCGVFEYLDLTMWAKLNEHDIRPDFLSKIISNGKFTAKEIGGKVKRNSQNVMSFEYLEQLSVDIKNNKFK
jgi:hypothetical protein